MVLPVVRFKFAWTNKPIQFFVGEADTCRRSPIRLNVVLLRIVHLSPRGFGHGRAAKSRGLKGRRSPAQGATLGKERPPPEPPRFGGLKGRRKSAQTLIQRKATRACQAGESGSEGRGIVIIDRQFAAPLRRASSSMRSGPSPRVSPWAGFRRPFRPNTGEAPHGGARSESQGFTLGWVPSALQAEEHAVGYGTRFPVARSPRVSPWAGLCRPFRPANQPGLAAMRCARRPRVSPWARHLRLVGQNKIKLLG